MHILILSNLVSYTYNFRKEVIDTLLEKGHKITVVCDNDSPAMADYFSSRCSFISVPFNGKGKNPLQELSLIRTYRRIIKEVKPDAVLSYTIKMNLYGGLCLRGSGIKWIPMITGLGELEKEGRLRTILMFLHRLVMPHASCIFFQNEDNLKFFKDNNIKFKKARVLPGSGINLQKFTFREYPKDKNTVFAFVGRLTEAKGIEQFLDAAEALSSSSVSFVAAGKCDNEYLERVKTLTSEVKLKYLGMVDNSIEVISSCSCLVLPTWHPEGMSNVLLEACATGRPAICTDRTGCREIIKNGVNGLYCREKDSGDLIERMKEFIALPLEKKKQMGLEGRQTVERNFDRKIIVKAYLEELDVH
ncbi:MAG: glycosyltransferase family 4 protein [Sphaerochaetaceae bacterium]|nr:glycosyltransferase family 4 protein [Sphaerochaetaceae bacterium]